MTSKYSARKLPRRPPLAALALALLPLLLPLPAFAVTPQSTIQPSTGINFFYEVNTDPNADFGSLGTIRMTGDANLIPGGFAPSGQLLPIAPYAPLFNQLGTTFGGDGLSNFQLPNLTGRTPIGTGTGPGLSPYVLGGTAGVPQVTLGLPQMPFFVGGQNQAFTNIQSSLPVNYMIAINGIFPSTGGGGAAGSPSTPLIGQVFATTAAVPSNTLLPCDGRLLPINQFQALFSVLGTTYGGNGTSTFALPDLRGRAVVGVGNGNGLTPRISGEFNGTQSTTLLSVNLPAPYGADMPYNNMQPFECLQYMIALSGIFPNNTESPVGPTNSPFLGEIGIFAGTFVPSGWLPCDGRLLPINQNTALFALLGNAYGGNGTSTFALPDLRGRIPVQSDTANFQLGALTGTETLTLSSAQIPAIPEPSTLTLLALPALLLTSKRRP